MTENVYLLRTAKSHQIYFIQTSKLSSFASSVADATGITGSRKRCITNQIKKRLFDLTKNSKNFTLSPDIERCEMPIFRPLLISATPCRRGMHINEAATGFRLFLRCVGYILRRNNFVKMLKISSDENCCHVSLESSIKM